MVYRRHDWASRAGWIVAIAVFSHFILDGLVHVRELPVLGENSYRFGLGLWNHLAFELTLEAAMFVAGLAIYLRAPGKSASILRRTIFAVVLTALAVVTIAGQATSTVPPPEGTLRINWVCAPLFFLALCYGFDRVGRASARS
jgi:hypothetical protein